MQLIGSLHISNPCAILAPQILVRLCDYLLELPLREDCEYQGSGSYIAVLSTLNLHLSPDGGCWTLTVIEIFIN